MALPPGFDPNKMSFGPPPPKIEIPRNRIISSTNARHGRSLWWYYNHAIASLGNWFSDHIEKVIDIFDALLFLGYVVMIFVTLGVQWSQSGFWTGLGAGVLTGVVGWFVVGLLIYAVHFVINVVMYALRLLFWNGWTLLIAALGLFAALRWL